MPTGSLVSGLPRLGHLLPTACCPRPRPHRCIRSTASACVTPTAASAPRPGARTAHSRPQRCGATPATTQGPRCAGRAGAPGLRAARGGRAVLPPGPWWCPSGPGRAGSPRAPHVWVTSSEPNPEDVERHREEADRILLHGRRHQQHPYPEPR